MTPLTRRAFLKTAGVAGAAATLGLPVRRARAAEFTLKYGNNLPMTHPMNVNAKTMAAKIATQSHGRVDLQVYPNGQLGTDTDMLSQVRTGAIDFFTVSPEVIGTLVFAAQISGIGFAFKDYNQVWAAMDGELGAHVRKQIDATSVFALEKMWDNGYRQITTSTHPIATPTDMNGLKLRVPPSPLQVAMFRAFGTSPTSLNFSEVYSALQTHIVDGQENPLAVISTVKFYEVQKYCSLTNHTWGGFWFIGNKKSFARMPADLQAIVRNNINEAGMQQRQDVRNMNDSLVATLKGKGLQFNTIEHAPFRAKLASAGFYQDCKKKFGSDAWAMLEAVTGKLA